MNETLYTAFAGGRRLAGGDAAVVAVAARKAQADGQAVVIFADASGRTADFDLRGTDAEIAARLAPVPEPEVKRGPGRPKLGVSAREVTLLPRHWDWLAAQPGGASAALRRLVDDARKAEGDAGEVRAAREAAYRVMTTLAGNLPAYEEATRALFAGDGARLQALIAGWPVDVTDYVLKLAAPGIAPASGGPA